MSKELTLKERLESLEDEIRSLKYSVTRLNDGVEVLDKAIRELISVNQLLMAKLKDIAIPVVSGELKPKEKLRK
jgi:hypothetical protein